MSATVSTRWYFPDWLSDPGVRSSSLAARGLWMDLLCIAGSNKNREHGFVLVGGRAPTNAETARLVGSTVEDVEALLAELERNGVFSRDRKGVIYSRRMVRAEKNRKNGQLGWEAKTLKNRGSLEPLKPLIPEPEPSPSPNGERLRAKDISDWPADYREQFWSLYPRQTEKKAALAKLDAIRKSGSVPWSTLTVGVIRYAASVAGTEERYIKHPTTWLNKGCWDDKYGPRLARAAGDVLPFDRGNNGRAQLDVELRMMAEEDFK